MTPLQLYQSDLEQKKIVADDVQMLVVQKLQQLFLDFNEKEKTNKKFLKSFLTRKQKLTHGLYLWGGTGRGKTYLVDSFYECLPSENKYRVHFHRFMLDIHEQLENLPKTPNPLTVIAKKLSLKIKILCLDEFHVHDIADAMLLAGLLKAMFEQGITLVTTSNIAIHDLYKNGLQRERFMYAIALLQKYTEEINLGDGTDYRFNILDDSEHYYIIDDKNSREQGMTYLREKFDALSPCKPKTERSIEINHREINYISYADDIIWFEYKELFCTNRSANDYIELAERFHTIVLSNISIMTESDDAAAKRFIHFIDAAYDHNVKVLLTAASMPQTLYVGKRLRFAFDRTISRLVEMGTQRYLKLSHNPTGTIRSLSID